MTEPTPVASATSRWARLRLWSVAVVLFAGFVLVGARTYHLQVRRAPWLQVYARGQYLRDIQLPPHRGTIFDRNGMALARSVEVESVYVNPRLAPHDTAICERLGRALHADVGLLCKRLAGERAFVWLKRRITPEEARAVRALGFKWVEFAKEPKRFYPGRQLGGTVLGYAGLDGAGLEGVELGLDRYLRGSETTIPGLRDALGRELLIHPLPERAPSAGADVTLTIDRFIQHIAEQALQEGLDGARAKAATAVVLDPRSGEVLAMASIPALNPNEPERNRKAGPRNRAVTDPYEPGSTMKVFSVAAALDAGAVKPQDRVDCERGRFEVGAYTIHDTHPHGVLSVSEVIQKSSNIGAAKIARKLGKEALEGALRRMGFGKPTGIELPGERGGTVRPAARWGEIGLANVAFGQGITATPLQVTSALGAVGNGGWLTRPFILRRVQDAKGNVLYEAKPEGRQVLSQRAAAEMTEMLALVTQEGGTATAAAVPGYGVAGKTGTAQKVDSLTGRYSSDKWVSSFVGFVPASAPRLAIMVVVDEPQGQHYGGLVAAPIFKRVAVEALRYLGVPPDQEAAGTAVARGGGAEAAGSAGLAAGGKGGMADGGKVGAGMGALPAAAIFKARGGQTVGTDTENVPGEAEGVRGGADSLGGRAERLAGAMASVPGESAAAARPSEQRSDGDSAVVDQPEEAVADGWGGGGVAAGGGAGGPGTAGVTGTVWAAGTEVPDFTGMSMGEAVAAARRAGVRLEVWGSGRATSQSPGPGPARSRTRCRVSFSPPG